MDTYGSHEGYLYNLHTCSSAEAKRMWKESIKNQWDNKCAYCGSEEEITLDHIVPQTKGGSNHTTNLLACCKKCNGYKGHADWITWYIQQPFFSESKRQRIEDWMFPDEEEINHRLYAYKPRRNKAYWLHFCALCIILMDSYHPYKPHQDEMEIAKTTLFGSIIGFLTVIAPFLIILWYKSQAILGV